MVPNGRISRDCFAGMQVLRRLRLLALFLRLQPQRVLSVLLRLPPWLVLAAMESETHGRVSRTCCSSSAGFAACRSPAAAGEGAASDDVETMRIFDGAGPRYGMAPHPAAKQRGAREGNTAMSSRWADNNDGNSGGFHDDDDGDDEDDDHDVYDNDSVNEGRKRRAAAAREIVRGIVTATMAMMTVGMTLACKWHDDNDDDDLCIL